MKRFLLAVVAVTAAAQVGRGATADTYLNEGIVTNAPVIDATNFVNRGTFSLATGSLYDFSSVRNFTNQNVMRNGYLDQTLSDQIIFLDGSLLLGNSGFRFDTAPANLGGRYPAASFYNEPLVGNIASNASIYADYQLLVSATNIVNRGMLGVSEFGLISLNGAKVDASRGVMRVAAPSSSVGIYDRHWFFGTNTLRPEQNFTLSYPNTPIYNVISFPGYITNSRLMNFFAVGSNSVTSAEFIYESGAQRSVQIVFVYNPNPDIAVQIRSAGGSPAQVGEPIVEWSATDTNGAGQITTNALYLTDSYGFNTTNLYLTNLIELPYKTYRPINYTISRTTPLIFPFATPGMNSFIDKPASFWGTSGSPVVVTGAQYSAYGALISPIAGASTTVTNIRNSYGRVELTASRSLDLNLAQVDAFSYLKLAATNHFAGSSNATISAPFADVALASTNGNLNFTSLLKPSISRFSGTIAAYSAVWTNDVVFNGTTNSVRFNVLMVESALTNRLASQIFDLSLRSTNLVIGDNLNVASSLTLDAQRLTILTNAGVSVSSSAITWQNSAPNVRSLTNFGQISFPNTLNLVGRNANGTDRPYESLVNFGIIQGTSVSANATNILNQGAILSSVGPLTLQAATNITLPLGGTLSAPVSDVTLSSRNLVISNQTFTVGRTLNLNVTGQLSAGTNEWQVFHGITFPTKPTNGDLAYVTLRSKAIQSQPAAHQWPGLDRGLSVAGFSNNVALGVLELDGGINSLFSFTGNGAASNALYVDRLDLLNSATQLDGQGNLSQVSIAPGMTIYYAQATMDGASAAEFLDGKNGGRLRWLNSYAGPFSGTNVVYPDGSTNYLNAALVTSCNLDSDNDGVPNCLDPSPVFLPQLAQVQVSVVATPAPMLKLSWLTIAGATNKIYTATNSGSASWQFVTNLVSPPLVGPPFTNQYLAPLGTGSRFYRVTVEPAR